MDKNNGTRKPTAGMKKFFLLLVQLLVSHSLLAAEYKALKSFAEISNWKLNVEQWKLSLKVGTGSFTRGGEIPAEIVMTNISKSEGIALRNPFPILEFDISVTDTAGNPVKLTPEGDRILNKSGAQGNFALEVIYPSNSYSLKVDLAKLFELTAPGKYVLKVGKFETNQRVEKPTKVTGSATFIVK